jgi:hypothetical protein
MITWGRGIVGRNQNQVMLGLDACGSRMNTTRIEIHHAADNSEARVIAKSTLEAILEGKPIKQAFDGYRSRNRKWKQRILTAKDITDALFDEQQ